MGNMPLKEWMIGMNVLAAFLTLVIVLLMLL